MNEYAYCQNHMGVEVTVSLITQTETQAVEIMEYVYDSVHSYEKQFSRFLPDSELSRLNEAKTMVVSPEFFLVLQKCRELFIKTEGAFNPLLQISRYGYDKDFKSLPKNTVVVGDEENYNTDFLSISIDEETRRVILSDGQQLDFGGILKGYLAHKLSCNVLEKYPHCTGNIINLGGDLHTRGVDAEGEPFVFSVLNPITKKELPVTLTDTSLATSGTYKRVWQTSEGKRHHILGMQDTSNAKVSVCSVSVVHSDGAVADAYTKLFLIKNNIQALQLIEGTDVQYLIVLSDGTVQTNIV